MALRAAAALPSEVFGLVECVLLVGSDPGEGGHVFFRLGYICRGANDGSATGGENEPNAFRVRD